MGIEVAIGAMVLGTAGSLYNTNQARKQSKEAARAEQRRAEVQNIREVRSQVRAARMAQASIANAGAVSNTLGSSGVQGGIASVGGQLAGNLGYMSDIARENTSIFNSSVKAAQYSSNAAMFGQIGQLGSTIFSMNTAAKPNVVPSPTVT